MIHVETKTLPDSLQRALRAIGYGRADIGVRPTESYTQWAPSGQGQRAFTMAVNLATGDRTVAQGSWGGPNMFNPSNAVDLDSELRPLPPGFAIVQGTQGYKPSATVMIHPSNAAPLLPATAELSEREQYLVNVFVGLNSHGRKEHFARRSGEHGGPPSEVELLALADRGFITRNKAGAVAVTTAGRNARTRQVL